MATSFRQATFDETRLPTDHSPQCVDEVSICVRSGMVDRLREDCPASTTKDKRSTALGLDDVRAGALVVNECMAHVRADEHCVLAGDGAVS